MRKITPAQEAALFEFEDQNAQVWLGGPLSFFAQAEMVPFTFANARYVMIFEQAYDAVGGDHYFTELAAELAGGFAANPSCRIMKFMRAEATLDTAFDPKCWELETDKRYIYQFLDVLREVVEHHVTYVPDVKQYFYAAASEELQACYNRILRNRPANSNLNVFEKITEPLGKFYGFQRKEVGEPRNVAAQAG